MSRFACFASAVTAWTYGIQETQFEAVPARITSPARTVVDCFRFQRLIGREAALEALRGGSARQKSDHLRPDAHT